MSGKPERQNRGGQTYVVLNNDRGSLNIPSEAEKDERTVELVQVWEASGKEQVSLQMIWDDPFNWGVMLVDLAKHVAKGYANVSKHSVVRILARIKEAFDAEWTKPTDVITGKML